MFKKHDRVYYFSDTEKVYGTVTDSDSETVWAIWDWDGELGRMPYNEVFMAEPAHGPCPMGVSHV